MNNIGKKLKELLKWFFLKDIFILIVTALIVWGAQLFLPLFFNNELVPPIGMTYIYKAFATVGVAGIILWGSWFLFRVITPFAARYFDNKVKNDINHIIETDRPWDIDFKVYLRPLFFFSLYFAFAVIVSMIAQAKLF